MAYVFNYYSGNSIGSTIVASSTPYDGIQNNILLGSRGSDTFYAEAGAGLYNEMHGLRGDDIFYGATGSNNFNIYVGGAGLDKAIIPATSGSLSMSIDYQGGVVFTRADGGKDNVNSETEIIQFTGGNKYFNVSAGIDDTATVSNSYVFTSGDKLVISNDWLNAMAVGNVSITVRDTNSDGRLDTVLQGLNGTNSYTLLNYNLNEHTKAAVVGVYGEGILFDLA
jgi:hypothetical protein